MLEALWSVQFQSSLAFEGNGVVVLETGRILGGDSLMIYVGSYKVENGKLNAKLNVKKYADAPGMSSVVHLDEFNLELSGIPDDVRIVLSGHVVEDPARKISIVAVRRAELP